jgi:competence protein ComEC
LTEELLKAKPFVLLIPIAIAGILAGAWFVSWPWSLVATICCLGLLLLPFPARFKNLILVATLFNAFAVRYHCDDLFIPKNHLCTIDWQQVGSYQGMIKDAIYRQNGNHKYILQLQHVMLGDSCVTITGKILVYSDRHFDYGDQISLSKEWRKPAAQRNPGQFDYRNYLNRHDIHAVVYLSKYDSVSLMVQEQGAWLFQEVIEPVRTAMQRIIYRYNSKKVSPMLKALLLGERQDLDREIVEEFTLSGVVHVLAISGLHVGYIILFVTMILRLLRIPYTSQFIILLLLLTVYVLLVRLKPPVLRASLMAALYIYGKLREKRVDNLNVLLGTAFLLLLFEPGDLFNPGFQFSFMAVLGILLLFSRLQNVPVISNFCCRFVPIRYIWYGLLISISATVFTLPLTIYYYGIWPIYAILANLLVIPLIGIILFLAFIQLLVSVISIHLALGVGQLIDHIFTLLTGAVQITTDLPYAAWDLPKPSWFIILFIYAFLLSILLVKKRYRLKTAAIFIVLISIPLLIGIWNRKERRMILTLLDVGHGDAAVVHFPNSNTMLIDGGDSTPFYDNGIQTVLPYLKEKGSLHLTYVVVTHGHKDHAGGVVALLNRVRVDTVVINPYPCDTPLIDQITSLCHAYHIAIRRVSFGDCLYPDNECRVYILHPPKPGEASSSESLSCNDQSIVIKLQYGKTDVLFTGDIEEKGISCILPFGAFLESELVKLPHHGSMVRQTPAFLHEVNPMVAVASASAYRRFNLPSVKLMQFLAQNHIPFLHTGREGAVMFEITPTSLRRINWR